MDILAVILLACSVAVDGLGVGVAYGVRKVIVPASSILVISLMSSACIGTGMVFGDLFSRLLPSGVEQTLGGLILIFVGVWLVLEVFEEKESAFQEEQPCDDTAKQGGSLLAVVREPMAADVDRSGVISVMEAVVLGIALGLDAFGAGLGAAMTGFAIIPTVVSAGLAKLSAITLGLYIGNRLLHQSLGEIAPFIPGGMLILLGLLKTL